MALAQNRDMWINEIKIQKQIHAVAVWWFLLKEQKTYFGEKTVSSAMVLGK